MDAVDQNLDAIAASDWHDGANERKGDRYGNLLAWDEILGLRQLKTDPSLCDLLAIFRLDDDLNLMKTHGLCRMNQDVNGQRTSHSCWKRRTV